jgi:alginate O-acetyltransferase complex protein AlgI
MLFPTFRFLFFFLAVFIGFWYVFRRNLERRVFLVAASYAFYCFWDWRFCVLLLASTGANYGFGLLVGTSREHGWRKFFLVLSVVFNLLFLGFFKYYNFFAEQANELIRLAMGSPSAPSFAFPALSVILPVGISFYTFKAMSYVFDAYLCEAPAVKSFLDVALYVSFFPQLASGPIARAKDFFPEIARAANAGRDPDSRPIEFDRATALIIGGLVKKMVFANFLATLFVDPVFADPASFGTIELVLAAIGYSVVIFCDFAGYSDMAIGIALLLGFRTPANFNRPYASFSVTEFWKRWHISFSSWLRNYLYFSLGGSRFGLARTLFALVVTMILGGLWHGAALTFVAWGVMQGVGLALERAFGYGNSRSKRAWVAFVQVAGTFLFATVSWIVFRAQALDDVRLFFISLGNFAIAPRLVSPIVGVLIALGLAMHAIPRSVSERCFSAWVAIPWPVKGVAIAAFFVVLSVVSMSGVAPFIYFQF